MKHEIMENKELLFNLVKKLESGEIKFFFIDKKINERDKRECLLKSPGVKIVKIGEAKEVGIDKTLFSEEYDENWNKEFKENFYKEKAIKCWTKNCPNKILQTENDYKKIKVLCQEKHTRMVCLKCADMDAIEKLAEGEND